jgi:hypothetical protein
MKRNLKVNTDLTDVNLLSCVGYNFYRLANKDWYSYAMSYVLRWLKMTREQVIELVSGKSET